MKSKNALCGFSIAVVLLLGVLAGSAQTNKYLFTGSKTNITLSPGTYIITAYGAQGGASDVAGGLGAEMVGQFNFAGVTTLTLLVGGGGVSGAPYTGGGGGGSFVVNGSTPLVIAGGGGGGGSAKTGGSGLITTDGGNGSGAYGGLGGNSGLGGGGGFGSGDVAGGGGGGYSGDGSAGNGGFISGGGGGHSFINGGSGGGGFGSGSGGFGGGGGGGSDGGGGGGGYSGGGGGGIYGTTGFGGGGGSIIDSSAITNLVAVSGIASPDDSTGNGEIIITAVSTDSAPTPPAVGITTVSNLPVVVWPAAGTNFVLQMTTNLTSTNWVTITNGVPFFGLQITNAPNNAFFRLH